MAKGKHRGCGWLHKWQTTRVLETGPGLWMLALRCRRCGRQSVGIG